MLGISGLWKCKAGLLKWNGHHLRCKKSNFFNNCHTSVCNTSKLYWYEKFKFGICNLCAHSFWKPLLMTLTAPTSDNPILETFQVMFSHCPQPAWSSEQLHLFDCLKMNLQCVSSWSQMRIRWGTDYLYKFIHKLNWSWHLVATHGIWLPSMAFGCHQWHLFVTHGNQ